jgi:hypothetical protein
MGRISVAAAALLALGFLLLWRSVFLSSQTKDPHWLAVVKKYTAPKMGSRETVPSGDKTREEAEPSQLAIHHRLAGPSRADLTSLERYAQSQKGINREISEKREWEAEQERFLEPVVVAGPRLMKDARRQFYRGKDGLTDAERETSTGSSRSATATECWEAPGKPEGGWALGGMRPYESVRRYTLGGWKSRYHRAHPLRILLWSHAIW